MKKLKAPFKRRRPKTRFKYLRLLHDNAPAHNSPAAKGSNVDLRYIENFLCDIGR